MARWLVGLAAAVTAACGAGPHKVANPGTGAAALCAGPDAPPPIARAAPDAELAAYDGRTIAAVELVGAPALAEMLRKEIVLTPGEPLTRVAVAQQLRRLWRVGLIDDAIARVTEAPGARGVAVELIVHERGLLAGVDIELRGRLPARKLRRLRSLAGVIDDPYRAQRTARRLEDDLRSEGHWKAEVVARRRRIADGVRLCVGVAPGPRYELAAVEFPGAKAIPAKKLAGLIAQAEGAINARGGVYRADLLDLDLQRIQAEYYEIGHVMVQVGPPATVVDDKHARIRLTIPVTEGAQFTIKSIDLTGVAPDLVPAYRALVDVHPGDVFSRSALATGMENIKDAERKAGHAGNVLPLTEIDTAGRTIGVTLEVTP